MWLRSLAPASLTLLHLLPACSGPNTPAARPLLAPDSPPSLELRLPRLGGGMFSLRELRGKPVLLVLFTTSCWRCQAEAPLLERLHEQHAQRGLQVAAIALDGGSPVLVQTYAEFVGFRFPVLLSHPGDLELLGAFGQTSQLPRTVLLDGTGRRRLDHQGPTDFHALEAQLCPLLATGSDQGSTGTKASDAGRR